jgi:hypothetical protein
MKKIILAALVTLGSLNLFAAGPGVDEKVLEAFNKTFKNATNVSWTTLDQAYQVRFEQNQITSKITYDMNGIIIRTLRYYGEEQLPILVLTNVKNRFTDKKIYGVVEESSQSGTYYHITLEGPKNWLDVKADAYGTVTVEKKFRKA